MQSIWETVKTTAAQTPLVLGTKLYVPSPRSGLVARPRLMDCLEASLGTRLTLISAPAGFGKTTLVGEWARERQHRLAWLSLDARDNDPVRFWSYAIAALQQLSPRIGTHALGWLHTQPAGPIPYEQILTCLINELSSTAAAKDPILLVLDDMHVIQARAVYETLTFLLDHAPARLHLILTTRVDPALPLARWRARNDLVELRAADLRFTNQETAEFLNRVTGLALSRDQIAALDGRTEGWIAGLQLAAHSMRNQRDVSSFVAAFTGSNRYVLDYLVEEVLAQQPEETQQFLLQTSILDRMCAPLCEAISGEISSRRILESLESANLFVVALDEDRRWYRYHHLFAEFLRHRLDQAQHGDIPKLYRRASEWCESSGLADEAIAYALESKDMEWAAHLIEEYCTPALLRGEFMTMESWLGALPREIVTARPRLALAQAWTLLLTGQLDRIDVALQDAERALQRTPEIDRRFMAGEVTAIRAFVTTYVGDPQGTIELCEQALRELPTEARLLRGMLGLSLGSAYLFAGNLAAADETLSAAVRVAREESINFAHYLTGCLLHVEIVRGRLRRAQELCREALELAERSGQEHTLALSQILVFAGDLLREGNQLEAARPYLEESVALGERGGNSVTSIDGYFSLARLLFARGDVRDALALVPKIQEIARRTQIPHIIAQARSYCARIYLAAGQLAPASEWLATRGAELQSEWKHRGSETLTPVLESEYILLARTLLEIGKKWNVVEFLHEADNLLNKLLASAEQQGRLGRVVDIRIVQSLVLAATGNRAAAIATLERAIEIAAPERYVRGFVDEGECMQGLLVDCRAQLEKRTPRIDVAEYVDILLGAFPESATGSPVAPPASTLVEPLSARELEILQLIARDASNQEIADKLYLTVGTVKWHINHILSKLEVRNRHAAVKRAQELQLLH